MNVLAIDTVSRCCSVAISYRGVVRQEKTIGDRIHSSRLLGLVEQVLEWHRIGLQDIDLIVVDTGPGSFTGVRVGMGVAQGLAYGVGIDTCGVNSLAILAAGCGPGIVVPVIDARMGQVYTGAYSVSPTGLWEEVHAPVVCYPEKMAFLENETWLAVGDGWQMYRERLIRGCRNKPVFRDDCLYPEARFAISAVLDLDMGIMSSPLQLAASYIRNDVADKPVSCPSTGH